MQGYTSLAAKRDFAPEDNEFHVGVFSVESGRVLIGDPCYRKGEGLHIDAKAENGLWTVYARRDGRTIAQLRAYALHDRPVSFKIEHGAIPVDSGQAGVFDADKYWNDDLVTVSQRQRLASEKGFPFEAWASDADRGYAPGQPMWWYSYVSSLSCSKNSAGTQTWGCVSSSGYGDGSYTAELGYNEAGKLVAVAVDFMGDYEVGDEYEEEGDPWGEDEEDYGEYDDQE
mgnify:CR=1 FL=1